MKSSHLVSMAASILLIFSTVTAGAGPAVMIHKTGGATPAAIWVIFGCAGGVVLAALDASRRQHRSLTPYEAATCGVAYWFTVKP